MAFSEYRAQILNFFNFILNLKNFFGYIPIQWSLKYNFYPVLSFFQSPPSTLITNAFLCYKCIFCCDTVYASGDDCSRSLGIPQCTTPDPPLSLWPYHLFLFPLSIFFLCSYLFLLFLFSSLVMASAPSLICLCLQLKVTSIHGCIFNCIFILRYLYFPK